MIALFTSQQRHLLHLRRMRQGQNADDHPEVKAVELFHGAEEEG